MVHIEQRAPALAHAKDASATVLVLAAIDAIRAGMLRARSDAAGTAGERMSSPNVPPSRVRLKR